MPEEIKKQEVETTEVIKGKIKWFGKPSNPIPLKMARIGKAMRYTCTGMIALVNTAPSHIISAEYATTWSWFLSVAILISGGLELLVGVEPTTVKK